MFSAQLDFDHTQAPIRHSELVRKRKPSECDEPDLVKHREVEAEPHFEFSIPMGFELEQPHCHTTIQSQLGRIRECSSLFPVLLIEKIERDCLSIFQKAIEPQDKIAEYAALLYLLETGQYIPGYGFREKLAQNLYVAACFRRSEHKRVMGSKHKELPSGHELYLIKHFARMLYHTDGSYNTGGVYVMRYCLVSSRIQSLFKQRHIQQMLSTLASMEKELRFVIFGKKIPAVSVEMAHYIRLSQMLPQNFDVTPYHLCLELIAFLFFSVPQGATGTCYVVGVVRYLKESDPLRLCKYLMQVYASGKIEVGKHFVDVAYLIKDELDERRKENYKTVCNAVDLPLITWVKMMLPHEAMSAYAQTTQGVLGKGYLQEVFSAQIHNIPEIIARTTLQLWGINGTEDSPKNIKKTFVDGLLDFIALINKKVTEEQIKKLKFSLQKYFWFRDHSPSQVTREDCVTTVRRGQSTRNFELVAKDHVSLVDVFRKDRALYVISSDKLLEIVNIDVFYHYLIHLTSKDLPTLNEIIKLESLCYFFQKFMEGRFKTQEIEISKNALQKNLLFYQEGGSAHSILEALGALTSRHSLPSQSVGLFLDEFAQELRDQMPRTIILQTQRHICTARITHTAAEIHELKEQMVTLGLQRLQASCALVLGDLFKACFEQNEVAKHKAHVLMHNHEEPWTFEKVKAYCLSKGVNQEKFAYEFQRVVEKISFSENSLKTLCTKLFPALNAFQFNIIQAKLHLEMVSVTHSPTEIARTIRKEVIQFGFHSVDLNQIEAEIRAIEMLPPYYKIGYTNWESDNNPIFWAIGFCYTKTEIALFRVNKRKIIRDNREKFKGIELLYH